MSELITIRVLPTNPTIAIRVTPPARVLIRAYPTGIQGVPGPSGPPWRINETPTGAIDGSNDTFLALADFVPSTVQVNFNGQILVQPDDFHTTGLRTVIITRTQAPATGDIVRLNYQEN